MPCSCATLMSSSPRGACTSLPSMVTVTTSGPGATGITYRWSDGHWLIAIRSSVASPLRPSSSLATLGVGVMRSMISSRK